MKKISVHIIPELRCKEKCTNFSFLFSLMYPADTRLGFFFFKEVNRLGCHTRKSHSTQWDSYSGAQNHQSCLLRCRLGHFPLPLHTDRFPPPHFHCPGGRYAPAAAEGQSVIFCGQFNTCHPFSLPAPAFALV